jgi:hypothetical protein
MTHGMTPDRVAELRELAHRPWCAAPIASDSGEYEWDEMLDEIERLQEANRWRRVEDEMPSEDATVLGWTPYGHVLPVDRVGTGSFYGGHPEIIHLEFHVTHWRPLPDPPGVTR